MAVSAVEVLGSFGLERRTVSFQLRLCRAVASIRPLDDVDQPEVREELIHSVNASFSPDEEELLLDGVETHGPPGLRGVRTAEDDLRPDIWFIFFETRGYAEGV